MSQQGPVRRALDAFTSVCVAGASIAVIWSVVSNRSSNAPGIAPAGNAQLVQDVQDQQLKIPQIRGWNVDDVRASVAIVEFSDFQCPYCGRHARDTLPRLKQEFVDSARVAYVFMNYPLEAIHPQALQAAKAVTCARHQQRFWEVHDWLFKNQARLGSLDLSALATAVRIDNQGLQDCVEGADSAVRAEIAEGERLGVNSTPTFFLGALGKDGVVIIKRRINGAVPYDVFKTALAELVDTVSAGAE